MKLKVEFRCDEGVRPLFEGKADVETYGLASGVARAAVGRFHNAGTSTAAHHKAARGMVQPLGPKGQAPRQLARIVIVTAQRAHFH